MNGKKEDYNSEGISLEEPLLPGAETQAKNSNETEAEQLRLVIVFVAYVLFGSLVGVLQKLIAIPMVSVMMIAQPRTFFILLEVPSLIVNFK